MAEHSVIPPSSASIWGSKNGCTGWAFMAQQYPDLELSPDAMDGEASHEIGARMINEASRGRSVPPDVIIGSVAENGVIFTTEMYDAADIYANDVRSVMQSTGVFGGINLGIEQRLEMPNIHEKSFGTIDSFIFSYGNGHLYLWDYKFGYENVEVFENLQLLDYLSGLITRLKINGHDEQYITVHFRIIQPRAFHKDGVIREWKFNMTLARGYINQLHDKANEALGNSSITRTGPHCKYCQARHACEAALTAGMSFFETAIVPTPIDLSPHGTGLQLSIIKRAIKQLQALESGYEEVIKSLIKSGKITPGWVMETSYGREKWESTPREVIQMGDMLNIDLRKPDNVITPNAARKLGIDDDVIKAYSKKPINGLVVVPDDGIKARQVFGN